MSDLILQGVDDVLLDRLAVRAENNRRSVEEEAKGILADACAEPETNSQFLATLRDRAKARAAGRPQTDSADLIREARDQRYAACP